MSLTSACRFCLIDEETGFTTHNRQNQWFVVLCTSHWIFDRLDQTSVHALFSLSIRPNEHIGTLRYDPKKAKVGRIALLPAYRRLGIGKQMMLSFERQLVDGLSLADQAPSSLLDSSTPTVIRLHSQIPVIGFYSTIGYQPVGPTFIGKYLRFTSIRKIWSDVNQGKKFPNYVRVEEDGAPHQLMVKQLVPC
jgi:GNAT superfamily N-acetyltransferase